MTSVLLMTSIFNIDLQLTHKADASMAKCLCFALQKKWIKRLLSAFYCIATVRTQLKCDKWWESTICSLKMLGTYISIACVADETKPRYSPSANQRPKICSAPHMLSMNTWYRKTNTAAIMKLPGEAALNAWLAFKAPQGLQFRQLSCIHVLVWNEQYPRQSAGIERWEIFWNGQGD